MQPSSQGVDLNLPYSGASRAALCAIVYAQLVIILIFSYLLIQMFFFESATLHIPGGGARPAHFAADSISIKLHSIRCLSKNTETIITWLECASYVTDTSKKKSAPFKLSKDL